MTSPTDRKSLEEALKNIREGIPGSKVPLSHQDPGSMLTSLDTIKELERQLGIRPTAEQDRAEETRKAIESAQKNVEAARLQGRARGEELFGQGSLGRLGPAQQANLAPLERATGLAEQRAREGLSAEEEQILQERASRGISQSKETALRQARGIAGQLGQDSETARARETRILTEAMRAERDSAESIRMADLDLKRQSLAQFGSLAAEAGKTSLAGQEQEFNRQRTNLSQMLSESQGRITTEIANIGLAQATESLGVNRTLQSIALDFQQRQAQQALGLQQQELNKPAPEVPSPGGVSAICTAAYQCGMLREEIYLTDQEGTDLFVPQTAVNGYHYWAKPFARWLRTKPRILAMFLPLITAWSQHMAFKIGKTDKDSWLGWSIFTLGVPVCSLIGKLVSKLGGNNA